MNHILYIFNFVTDHSSKEFGFNGDFLEANVINILLLLFGLIYVLKQFLGSSLAIRQEKVLIAIQESEERLQQAKIRLAESEKQLAQTQVIIDAIQNEALITSQKVRESILAQGKLDIARLSINSKASIETAEKNIIQQIQKQITALAIRRVKLQLQSEIDFNLQTRILDNNIMQLGGKL